MVVDVDNVEHIPSHQETVDKVFETIKLLRGDVDYIEGAYEGGLGFACKDFLNTAEEHIYELRVLIGGRGTT